MTIAIQFIILSHDVGRAIAQIENLKPLIDRHCSLIKVSTQLNGIFSQAFFVNFYGSSVVICVAAVRMALSDDLVSLVKFGSFCLLILFHIISLCHLGNMLQESSQSVIDSIFYSQWYENGRKVARFTNMMQMQA
jgi:7tm Odorant receptor